MGSALLVKFEGGTVSEKQRLLDCLDQLIDSGFIDASLACPYVPPDRLYPEEVLDAFAYLPNEQLNDAYLFFDAEYYCSQIEGFPEAGFNPLEHFLCQGILT